MTEARSPTLLIVEDDLALQKQLRWSLDRFEAVTAADAASALLQFRKHQPGVVTMDLGLPPDQDGTSEGFKLLEKLLEIDPYVKLIVLTGQNEQSNLLEKMWILVSFWENYAYRLRKRLIKLLPTSRPAI